MATFAFKAVDLAGIPQSGVIDGAESKTCPTSRSSK